MALTRAPERESSLAREEHPSDHDDAELSDGEKSRSKRSQGHSPIYVGGAGALSPPPNE
jgi:hypothetical protein